MNTDITELVQSGRHTDEDDEPNCWEFAAEAGQRDGQSKVRRD